MQVVAFRTVSAGCAGSDCVEAEGDVARAAGSQLAEDHLRKRTFALNCLGDSSKVVLSLPDLRLGDDEEHFDGAGGASGAHLAGDLLGVCKEGLARIEGTSSSTAAGPDSVAAPSGVLSGVDGPHIAGDPQKTLMEGNSRVDGNFELAAVQNTPAVAGAVPAVSTAGLGNVEAPICG